MRHRFWAVAVLALAVTAQGVRAQPYPRTNARTAVVADDNSVMQSEINQLRARLAALEDVVAQPETVAPGDPMYQPPQGLTSQGGDTAPTYQGTYVPTMVYQQKRGRWTSGFNGYLLKAQWSNSGGTAFHTTTSNTAGTSSTTTNTDFSYNYQIVPAIWLGYVHQSGNGVRFGLFQYNQNSTVSGTAGANQQLLDAYTAGGNFGFGATAPGDRLVVASALQVIAYDIEGTKQVTTNDWTWTGSAGLRYMYLNQSYNDVLFNAAGTTLGGLNSRHFFNGAGPTLSFQGRRSVFNRGFGFYGIGRGSVMFGNNISSFSQSSTLGGPPSTDSIFLKSWGTVPVTELEVGIDLRRTYGRLLIICDNGIVGQSYFGVGSLSGTHAADGSTSDATLGMYGIRSSVGVYY